MTTVGTWLVEDNALNAVSANHFLEVLMDIRMPVMGGTATPMRQSLFRSFVFIYNSPSDVLSSAPIFCTTSLIYKKVRTVIGKAK